MNRGGPARRRRGAALRPRRLRHAHVVRIETGQRTRAHMRRDHHAAIGRAAGACARSGPGPRRRGPGSAWDPQSVSAAVSAGAAARVADQAQRERGHLPAPRRPASEASARGQAARCASGSRDAADRQRRAAAHARLGSASSVSRSPPPPATAVSVRRSSSCRIQRIFWSNSRWPVPPGGGFAGGGSGAAADGLRSAAARRATRADRDQACACMTSAP